MAAVLWFASVTSEVPCGTSAGAVRPAAHARRDLPRLSLPAGGDGRNETSPAPRAGAGSQPARSWPRHGSPPEWPDKLSGTYAAAGPGTSPALGAVPGPTAPVQ